MNKLKWLLHGIKCGFLESTLQASLELYVLEINVINTTVLNFDLKNVSFEE
jgi:hypothetical protein